MAALDTVLKPWAIMGDFNTIQDLNESTGGTGRWTSDMSIFKNFLTSSGLSDIHYSGAYHTWWNNQSSNSITRKLDRILGNADWLSTQQNSDAVFLPWGMSDHCASILNLPTKDVILTKPFQFYNYWLDRPDFMQIMKDAWDTQVHGNLFYIIHCKLNIVKKKLSNLRRRDGSINSQLAAVKGQLCDVQEMILNNTLHDGIFYLEKSLNGRLWDLFNREESIAHQRSRVQWLELGDKNTAYFHKKVAANWNNRKIPRLIDSSGMVLSTTEDIKNEAVSHFQNLFTEDLVDYPGIDQLHLLIKKKITPAQAQYLTLRATDEEILKVLKSMKRNRSPGPDGFNVSSILNSTGWSLPSSNYHDMIVWRSNFNTSTPFNLQKRDDISWNGIASKSIKVTNLWHSIRHTSPPVPWFSNIWHKLGVPRYSFQHWLIMHGRVNTLSRLKLFGMVTLDTCYFCINGVENAAHLFLECPYTQMVFRLITSGRCASMHTDWSSWRQFLTQANRDIHSIIQILIFQVVTYNIGKERRSLSFK
ncbi:hypothetical protein POM88_045174 [Heracleum sosnowskyi]|uniref:Reverse transcriptase zinc-binding domain-containing protein n=1 Tax=Heracleum sosnowskyi TaxID=360622 RepID=A0AAD8H6W3_9APIA|nr:hypothetical protein POM88_045174 [Heracleum sosnowskyi]